MNESWEFSSKTDFLQLGIFYSRMGFFSMLPRGFGEFRLVSLASSSAVRSHAEQGTAKSGRAAVNLLRHDDEATIVTRPYQLS